MSSVREAVGREGNEEAHAMAGFFLFAGTYLVVQRLVNLDVFQVERDIVQ